MTQRNPETYYVALGRADKPPLSYTWRIWSGGSSFYMKSSILGMKHLKLSVHGDDPRHPGGGGYKLAMDTEESWRAALASGEMFGRLDGTWPIWFPGSRITDDATLVARLRWTYEAVSRLGPAPAPAALKNGAKGLAVRPPPEPGTAVDLDLIVSRSSPHWINEKAARADDACMGPLRNSRAGLWLTGTAVRRFVPHAPHPTSSLGPRPKDRTDQLRGMAAAVDESGFLWMIEHRVSKSAGQARE